MTDRLLTLPQKFLDDFGVSLRAGDAKRVGRMVDWARARGWKHCDLAAIAMGVSGVDEAQFDAILYEADSLESGEE